MELNYQKNQRINDTLFSCGFSYNLKSVSSSVNPNTKEPLTKRWKCSVRDCYEKLLSTHNHDAKSTSQLFVQETLSDLKSKVIENASISVGITYRNLRSEILGKISTIEEVEFEEMVRNFSIKLH